MNNSSWLVQRLCPPYETLGDNPFASGGGMRNGGLSDEAMDLLRGIFRFDYMGAAEFEFGEVPRALGRIAEQTELVAGFFEIPLAKVQKAWNDKSKTDPKGSATIYTICNESWSDEVETRIRGWAAKDYVNLKEATLLPQVLRGPVLVGKLWVPDVCGWLELDNGFFFFTDALMWKRTADLFGATTNGGPDANTDQGEMS